MGQTEDRDDTQTRSALVRPNWGEWSASGETPGAPGLGDLFSQVSGTGGGGALERGGGA